MFVVYVFKITGTRSCTDKNRGSCSDEDAVLVALLDISSYSKTSQTCKLPISMGLFLPLQVCFLAFSKCCHVLAGRLRL